MDIEQKQRIERFVEAHHDLFAIRLGASDFREGLDIQSELKRYCAAAIEFKEGEWISLIDKYFSARKIWAQRSDATDGETLWNTLERIAKEALDWWDIEKEYEMRYGDLRDRFLAELRAQFAKDGVDGGASDKALVRIGFLHAVEQAALIEGLQAKGVELEALHTKRFIEGDVAEGQGVRTAITKMRDALGEDRKEIAGNLKELGIDSLAAAKGVAEAIDRYQASVQSRALGK